VFNRQPKIMIKEQALGFFRSLARRTKMSQITEVPERKIAVNGKRPKTGPL